MSISVSVLCSSFRPGGIDILLAGMRDQSFRNFEVILVDRRYERRHEQVLRLASEYNINIIHVPEYRRNGKWTSFVSGWNTAIALSRGEIIIFLQDWMYCPSNYIQTHVNALSGMRRYVVAPYVYLSLPPIKFYERIDLSKQAERTYTCVDWDRIMLGGIIDETACFEGGLFSPLWLSELESLPAPDQDPRQHQEGRLQMNNWVHMKNESLLRSLALELNGLDERLERGRGPMDTDWGNRLRLAGVEHWWSPAAITWGPNPRFLVRVMPWGDIDQRIENRWSYRDGERYCQKRVDEILAGGDFRAKNSYDVGSLGVRLASWRDGRLEPAPLDVSDEVYWKGRVPWPED